MEASRSFPTNQHLRRERIQRSWRQHEVADRIGATVISVKRWEQGKQPSAYFREKLCQLFGKSAEELGLVPDTRHSAGAAEPEAPAADQTPLTAFLTENSYLWGVPYPRNPFFTGREAILQHIHKTLRQEQTMALTQSWAISGLGGIGKTQTAIEYAYRYADDYAAIFWLSAETSESLVSSFVALAGLLHLSEKQEHSRVVAAVTRWLVSHSNWLPIFDNVEDLELVKSMVPPARCGHLLFTSRQQALGLAGQTLTLDLMTVEEGTRFLLHRARHLDPAASLDSLPPIEQASAREIVAEMDGLPLALDQAGAYIEATQCGLSDYLQFFRSSPVRLLDEREAHCDHPLSVTKTFALAYAQLEQRSPAAAELLTVCAFFAPEAIPEAFFIEGAASLGPTFEALASDPLEFHTTLKALLTYSLIQRNATSHTIAIHRLLQAVLRNRMDIESRRRWATLAVEVVNHAFPSPEELTTWQHCQCLLPHAFACTSLMEQEDIVTPAAGHLLHKAGTYLLEVARYEQAEHFLRQALRIRREVYGNVHVEVADSLNHLAELAYYRGQYQEAERIHQQALAMRQTLLGPQHLAVAASMNNLAGVYCMQGRYAEAAPLYEQVLRMKEHFYGSEHLSVAESLQNLAYLYEQQGRLLEAEPLYRRCLAICQRRLESDHGYLTTILNNLGRLLLKQCCYQEATPLLEHALAICKRHFSADHPRLALTYTHLAHLAQALGDTALAEQRYRQALQILEQCLGSDHPRAVPGLSGLASLYLGQGHIEQARELLGRALAIRERTFGSQHPETRALRVHYQSLLPHSQS